MFGQAHGSVYKRVYVHVLADHLADGRVVPRVLFWQLDQADIEVLYKIDSSTYGEPAHARKAGGQGIRYVIEIHGKKRELYYDDFEGRFFVEARS